MAELTKYTPAALSATAVTVQQSCLDCGFSEHLDIEVLSQNDLVADTPLPQLLKLGTLFCRRCDSLHLVLAARNIDEAGSHLMLSRSPYPVGELASSKNISINGSDRTVFIPYTSDGKSKEQRHAYVDLTLDPEAILSLPEVRSSAAASAEFGGNTQFQRMIEQINSLGNFCTLGCSWETSKFKAGYLTYGYIDLARLPLQHNNYVDTRELAQSLMTRLSRSADPETRFIISIKMGIYELRPMYVLDVEAIARADSPSKAFLKWESILVELTQSIGDVAMEKDA